MIQNKILSTVVAVAISGSTLFANVNNDKVYATVNGMKVTSTDVAMVIKDPRVKFDNLPKQTQKQVLNQIIDKKLLANKAIHTDIINSRIYKDTLKSTIEALKHDLALQMWIQKLSKDIKIDDKEAKKYYEQNRSQFVQPEELKASHILVKTKKEAEAIIAQLKKSKNLKADFTKLAKEKSIGPSGKNGGELGWFTKDRMKPEFSMAASMLKVGSITTTPVHTSFGYHIIYLDGKKKAQTISYDQVKGQIKQYLSQLKFKKEIDKVLKDLKAKANIVYK